MEEDWKLKKYWINALPVYDDRYIKTKIRTYGDEVYTNNCSLNVIENDIECESFTVTSTDSLVVYESKYYLQVYLDNFTCSIVNKQVTLVTILLKLMKISFQQIGLINTLLWYNWFKSSNWCC